MQRQFTSGSRQAPDPFDQFLEEHNFYRKHTARDASCLFRVISEQMYDTQLHHLAIRKKCVRYMRKHRDFFQPLVERDLDEYLDDMSKPKSYGTLIELQAVGYMFQRNVLLFEPFNLGNFYNNRSYFTNVFRVFYTPERHFDSVFTCDYIKDAAICQSICYEILYKDLFKLPDVSFAVEQMLHAPTFESTDYRTESNEDGYCTRINLADGRIFDFDLPQNTNCILENYKLCHFHYTNFPRFSDDLQRELKVYSQRDEFDKSPLSKTAESLLPNKYISCVRQLLQEGITPFPYKVAKALDPNMYRNIEFDAWNEARKELKLQNWYNGDSNFKVGAKCHVKLRKSENDLYTCHIQEMAVDKGYCIVFIEQLGEKRLVPYDSLTPLPPDQFKPWTLPYRFQRHMHKYSSSVRFTRHYNYRFKFNGQFSATHEYCAATGAPLPIKSSEYCDLQADDCEEDPKQHYAVTAAAAAAAAHHRSSCYYKLKQYTHLENFRTHTVEYCTMPLTVEHTQTPSREMDPKVTQRPSGGRSTTPSGHNEQGSRAPSRSSTSAADIQTKGDGSTISGPADDASSALLEHYDLEQGVGGGSNGAYLPELHYFYPMPQYGGCGGPEEYYGYGYDGGMHPPAALMPAGTSNGGTFYYMCSAGAPTAYPTAGNNLYMQGPQQIQPPQPILTAASPHHANGGGYYPNPYYSNASTIHSSTVGGSGCGVPPPFINAPSYNNNTPSTRGGGRSYAPTTPLSARINWEAKKSLKPNGNDLPSDVATLRYFYNLGLDYHHKHFKRGNEDIAIDSKENVAKLTTNMQNVKLDENGNQQHDPKSDANNNNMPNANLPQTNTNSNSQNPTAINQNQTQFSNTNKYQQRRFPSRYFNSKERQAYQRNLAATNGSNNNLNSVPNVAVPLQPNRNQNSLNTNKNGNATPNSNNSNVARNQMQNSNSGGNLAISVAEQGIQTSPMMGVGFDATTNANTHIGDINQTPTTYCNNPNQIPNIVYGGAYEYGQIDPTAAASQLAPPPGPGGVYIQMPMAPSPYGIYTAPPPPPAMHPTAGGGAAYPPSFLGPPPPTNMSLHGSLPPGVAASTVNGNGFFAASPSDIVENGENGGGVHFQCMGYPPPPMPQSSLGPQGYWYMPTNPIPNQPPPPGPHINGGGINNNNNSNAVTGNSTQTGTNNRRDKQQQIID